jgi:hypothetical protein
MICEVSVPVVATPANMFAFYLGELRFVPFSNYCPETTGANRIVHSVIWRLRGNAFVIVSEIK